MRLIDDLFNCAAAGSVLVIGYVAMQGNGATPSSAAMLQRDQQAQQSQPMAAPVAIPGNMGKWFATSNSMGSSSIASAEGNYTILLLGKEVQIRLNRIYWKHRDPGNGVTNYGWCSDQGRSGGNIELADKLCLKRTVDRLPTIVADMKAAGLDPEKEAEAAINAADLYNQASPVHSRRFPGALVEARRRGMSGTEAIIWARTKSFYNGTRNEAGGLLGICRRENRNVTEWDCVAHDQGRRARAIASTIKIFSTAGVTEGKRVP